MLPVHHVVGLHLVAPSYVAPVLNKSPSCVLPKCLPVPRYQFCTAVLHKSCLPGFVLQPHSVRVGQVQLPSTLHSGRSRAVSKSWMNCRKCAHESAW